MPKLSITSFDGIIPRMSTTLLAQNQAQVANNVRLYSGELRNWDGPLDDVLQPPTPTAGVKTLFKYYYSTTSYLWFIFSDNVNLVQSPATDTADYRLYYTDGTRPKKTNYAMASAAAAPGANYPHTYYYMGTPAPTAAPTVAFSNTGRAVTITIASPGVITLAGHGFVNGASIVLATTGALPTGLTAATKYYVANVTVNTFELSATSGGASIVTSGTQSGTQTILGADYPETRVYVYTHVSTFGSLTEESAPSPASAFATIYSGGQVTINGFSAAPTAQLNITSRRIYRSITGASTSNYVFVAEIAVGVTSYVDTLTSSQLGEALGTIGWLEPPVGLLGLVSHPSGSLAGFLDNTVYFSEPFKPHAWPLAYAINVPSTIVGLAIFGSSVVVMTDRHPYIITGSYPGAMSSERIPILEPCISRASIISDEFGVVYASPNGMVGIGPSSRGVTTTGLFALTEWQAYYPSLTAGAVINNTYISIYPADFATYDSFAISRQDTPALSKLTQLKASALHVDSKGGKLYYVDAYSGKVKVWAADTLNPLNYVWRSKRFVLPQATSYASLKLDAEYTQMLDGAAYTASYDAVIARNQTKSAAAVAPTGLFGGLNCTYINQSFVDTSVSPTAYRGLELNGSELERIPLTNTTRTVQITVFGDGVQQGPAYNLTSWDPIRLSAFKCREIELQITGNINVRSVSLATTTAEFRDTRGYTMAANPSAFGV